jgi:two-component system KDP operon response regulator KdpE
VAVRSQSHHDEGAERVLVVIGDRPTAAALRYGGYEVRTAPSLKRAGSLLRRERFAVVVLGPSVNDEDRARLTRELRLRTDLPIIALGPNPDELHAVRLLDAGADDYLSTPIGSEELLAHVRARLRRARHPEVEEPIVTPAFTIHLDDRRLVLANGSEPKLSPLEWRLIEILAGRAGHLASQPEVLANLWGSEGAHKGYHLRALMAGIRKKTEPEPSHPRYFITVPGLGVKLETDRSTDT